MGSIPLFIIAVITGFLLFFAFNAITLSQNTFRVLVVALGVSVLFALIGHR